MSDAWKLPRVPPPPPQPEPPLCAACQGMRAECVAPVGETSMPLCWLCAHHVVDHGVAPGLAMTAECECLPEEIFPDRLRIKLVDGVGAIAEVSHAGGPYVALRTGEPKLNPRARAQEARDDRVLRRRGSNRR